ARARGPDRSGLTAGGPPGPAGRVPPPFAPGLVVPVGVSEIELMHPGSAHPVDARVGVIAVDGERELTIGPDDKPVVRLRADGPLCVDVPAVLTASARLGLLTSIHQTQGGAHDRHG